MHFNLIVIVTFTIQCNRAQSHNHDLCIVFLDPGPGVPLFCTFKCFSTLVTQFMLIQISYLAEMLNQMNWEQGKHQNVQGSATPQPGLSNIHIELRYTLYT